jgi:hypothetical protein
MYGHVYIQLRPPQIVKNAQSSPLIHRYSYEPGSLQLITAFTV